MQDDINRMTSDFGCMLLHKIQESHDQTQNLITNFMTKQTELQTQFWYDLQPCYLSVRSLAILSAARRSFGSSRVRKAM